MKGARSEGGFRMTDQPSTRDRQIRLSAPEERFLKAFVRRQVTPLLGGIALAFGAVLFALASTQWMVAEPHEGPAAAEAPPVAELEQAWRSQLAESWGPRLASADEEREALERQLSAALARVAKLERRLGSSEQRIDRVEARFDAATPPAAMAPGTGSTASTGLAPVLKRLHNVEKRIDRQEQQREAFEGSVLARVDQAEALRVNRVQESIETEKSILNRLYQAEARLEALEATR